MSAYQKISTATSMLPRKVNHFFQTKRKVYHFFMQEIYIYR